MDNPIKEHFRSILGKGPVDGLPGFSGWLRAELIDMTDDTMTIAVAVREDMCNPAGSLHGGVQAAILDEVMGMMTATLGLDHHFVALNITVDFQRPAFAGQVLHARAEVVRKGRSVVYLNSSLLAPDGKLVARCTQNMVSSGISLKH
jgi:acyl-coenzyme A thioesterase 13